jgi:hypothetical protein
MFEVIGWLFEMPLWIVAWLVAVTLAVASASLLTSRGDTVRRISADAVHSSR